MIDIEDLSIPDQSLSVAGSISDGGYSRRDEVAEIKKSSVAETRRVQAWRLIVTGLLLATGAVVAAMTYRLLMSGQINKVAKICVEIGIQTVPNHDHR